MRTRLTGPVVLYLCRSLLHQLTHTRTTYTISLFSEHLGSISHFDNIEKSVSRVGQLCGCTVCVCVFGCSCTIEETFLCWYFSALSRIRTKLNNEVDKSGSHEHFAGNMEEAHHDVKTCVLRQIFRVWRQTCQTQTLFINTHLHWIRDFCCPCSTITWTKTFSELASSRKQC